MIHSWWQDSKTTAPLRWSRIIAATTLGWITLLIVFTTIHSLDMSRLEIAHTIAEVVQAQAVIMIPWLVIFPAVALTRARQLQVRTPLWIAMVELVLLGAGAILIIYLHIILVYAPFIGAPPEQILDQIPLINWVWDPVMIALTALISDQYTRAILRADNAPAPDEERIVLRNGRQEDILEIADIIAVSAQGNYVVFVSAEREWLQRATLAELVVQLTERDFIHIHRSHLVRSSQIKSCARARGRIVRVTLASGHEFPVSARGAEALQSHITSTTLTSLPARALG
ncbi:LytTR family DNA-binding domain-containing protein [uncultured Maricaulis sp.]|uniref:LytTR family DNA-binding domain-containing protein n=1 Tax=uncultured Maricaulis sp. TaxID=174710 RepID=UPI0026030E57|nr:LytTR family DNA-binding domain-containing protein [uncultured Maricaulis sp.]